MPEVAHEGRLVVVVGRVPPGPLRDGGPPNPAALTSAKSWLPVTAVLPGFSDEQLHHPRNELLHVRAPVHEVAEETRASPSGHSGSSAGAWTRAFPATRRGRANRRRR